jgi:hypothetical protein
MHYLSYTYCIYTYARYLLSANCSFRGLDYPNSCGASTTFGQTNHNYASAHYYHYYYYYYYACTNNYTGAFHNSGSYYYYHSYYYYYY